MSSNWGKCSMQFLTLFPTEFAAAAQGTEPETEIIDVII